MAKDLDQKVLEFLARNDWPVTTENVAEAVGVSWNTAQVHLYKLMAEGKVRGHRVGRQNQWAVVEKAGER